MTTPARTIDDSLTWIDTSVKAYEAGEWDRAAAAAHIAIAIAAAAEAKHAARDEAGPPRARKLIDPPAVAEANPVRTAQDVFDGVRLGRPTPARDSGPSRSATSA